MKPVLRYQSQLLFRKSYKPNRVLRIRPTKLRFSFRPVRFGLKPQIKCMNDTLKESPEAEAREEISVAEKPAAEFQGESANEAQKESFQPRPSLLETVYYWASARS